MTASQKFRAQWYEKSLYGQKPAWLRFLRHWLGSEVFIREVVFGHRRLTQSIMQMHNQMLYFLSPKMPATNAFVSVYAYEAVVQGNRRTQPDYSTAIIDRLLFDFDSEDNLAAAYNDMLELNDRLKADGFSRHNVFTAGKGFQVHALLKLPPGCPPQPISPDALRSLQEGWARNLSTADTTVWGDTARVSRIPFTPHAKHDRVALLLPEPVPELEVIIKRSQEIRPKPTWEG